MPSPEATPATVCSAGPLVLVVALTNQPPAQDKEVMEGYKKAVQDYGVRLQTAHSGSWTGNATVRGQTFDLYQPGCCYVSGHFDTAVSYLADNLEHVTELGGHRGASAQEVWFGPLPSEPSAGAVEVLKLLLKPDESKAQRFVGLFSIKLDDPIAVALGPELMKATLVHVQQMAVERRRRALVLRSWAWADLLVLVEGESPQDISDFGLLLHELRLGDVRGALVALRGGDASVEVDGLPGQLLYAYQRGPWPHGKLHERSIRLDDWGGKALFYDVRVHIARTQGAGAGKEESSSRTDLHRSSEVRPTVFLVQVKPGHWMQVQTALKDAVRDYWPESLGSAKIFRSVDGRQLRLLLRLESNEDPRVLYGRLTQISQHLRSPQRSNDILDVSTTFDLIEDSSPSLEDADTQPSTSEHGQDPNANPDLRDRDLLRPQPPRFGQEAERALLTRLGLGAAERDASLSFIETVLQTAGNPLVYASMLDLLQAVELFRRELLELAVTPKGEHTFRLKKELQKIRHFVNLVYLQRIQYTPLIPGGQPLEAEVPFGVNQLAGLMNSVTECVLAIAHVELESEFPGYDVRKRGAIFTMFGTDDTFAIRHCGHLVVLKMPVLAAMNPLTYPLLYHELGHHIESALRASPDSSDKYAGLLSGAKWKMHLGKATQRLCLEDANGVKAVLDDLFAHTVWRRLGCGMDKSCEDGEVRAEAWKLFETQYLLAFSLGLVQDFDRTTALSRCGAWARALLQLWIQKELATFEEKAGSGLEGFIAHARCSLEGILEWIRELGPWWRPQLGDGDNLATIPNDGDRDCVEPPYMAFLLEEEMYKVLEKMQELGTTATSEEGKSFACLIKHHQVCFRRLTIIEQMVARSNTDESVLNRDGAPTPQSFVQVRGVINGLTRWWQTKTHNQQWKTIFRDPETLQYIGTSPPDAHSQQNGSPPPPIGLYADTTGRLFAFSDLCRKEWQNERARVLDALLELSGRIRAGHMWRHFHYRREFPRYPYMRVVQVQYASTAMRALLLDIGLGGAQLAVGPDFPQLNVGNTLGVCFHEGSPNRECTIRECTIREVRTADVPESHEPVRHDFEALQTLLSEFRLHRRLHLQFRKVEPTLPCDVNQLVSPEDIRSALSRGSS